MGINSICKFGLFLAETTQYDLTEGEGYDDWKSQLRDVLYQAGINNRKVAIFLREKRVSLENMYYDVEVLADSGIPGNLLSSIHEQQIIEAYRDVHQDRDTESSDFELLESFKSRVKQNLHIVLQLHNSKSYKLRQRLLNHPKLVDCFIIDFFNKLQ